MRHVTRTTRRERREVAKKYGLPFRKRYAKGLEPKTHLEMFGVGYERFDSKYVTVSTETTSVEVE